MTVARAFCVAAFLLMFLAPVAAAQQQRPEPGRYRAVLELSVGSIDGPVALTRVEYIVVHGGRVFVTQPAEDLIRVLSADSGEILQELGGTGEGPGEFRGLYWVVFFGDSLVTVDTQLRRISAFGADGSLIDARRYDIPPPSPPFRFGAWTMATRGGNMIVSGSAPARDPSPPESNPWLLVSTDGTVLDRLPPIRLRDRIAVLRRRDGVTAFSRPISRSDRFALAPDGTRFAQAGEAEPGGLSLTVYHTLERRTQQFHFDIPAIPVPAAVADSVRRRLRDTLTGRGLADRVDRRELEQALAVPERVPAADEMFVTNEGEVWLREPNFSGQDHVWRVVGPDGNVGAVVEVPSVVVLRARHDEHLWGFRVDPRFGVFSVVRLRLEPVPRGASTRRRPRS